MKEFKTKPLKKVFFQGAFDILNAGHIRAFKDAKRQGQWLIVALNTDELIREYKGREAIIPYEQRKEILQSLKMIDEVIPATTFSPLRLLKKLKIDVYVIYIDWKESKAEEIAYMNSVGGKIFFTPEYDSAIHSSLIRKRCVEQFLRETEGSK